MQDYLKVIYVETPRRPILCTAKYNDGYSGPWALYGIAFGKIIKTNQDILTFLKLKNYWKWIDNVIEHPNRRHLYKAPKNQKKESWNPFKKIPKFINRENEASNIMTRTISNHIAKYLIAVLSYMFFN